MPEVSIIIPVYNSENTIERAINSVLSQTFTDYEIIIINDGSIDNSEEIIKTKFNDVRVKYFYKSNGGVSSARNYGIKRASGEYIIFLDSDDYYSDEYSVESYIKSVSSNTIYVCKDSTNNVNSDDLFMTHDKNSLEFLITNELFNSPCNKCYSRDIIISNNILFDEDVNLGEDLIFNANYFKYIENIFYEDKARYVYDHSFSPNSLTKTYDESYFEAWKRVISAIENLYNYKKFNKQEKFYMKLYIEMMSIVFIPLVTRSEYNLNEKEDKVREYVLESDVKLVLQNTIPDRKIPFLSILLIMLKNNWIKLFIFSVNLRFL